VGLSLSTRPSAADEVAGFQQSIRILNVYRYDGPFAGELVQSSGYRSVDKDARPFGITQAHGARIVTMLLRRRTRGGLN